MCGLGSSNPIGRKLWLWHFHCRLSGLSYNTIRWLTALPTDRRFDRVCSLINWSNTLWQSDLYAFVDTVNVACFVTCFFIHFQGKMLISNLTCCQFRSYTVVMKRNGSFYQKFWKKIEKICLDIKGSVHYWCQELSAFTCCHFTPMPYSLYIRTQTFKGPDEKVVAAITC
jgi:hypothetical protein